MSVITKNCIATIFEEIESTLPATCRLTALTVVDVERVRADGRILIRYMGRLYIVDGSVLEY